MILLLCDFLIGIGFLVSMDLLIDVWFLIIILLIGIFFLGLILMILLKSICLIVIWIFLLL